MISHLPDWVPFACLATGRLMRKPAMTRIAESIMLGLISGGLSLYVGVKVLEHDVIRNRDDMIAHLKWAGEQVEKRDADFRLIRAEIKESRNEVMERLNKIEECLRLRTCVK